MMDSWWEEERQYVKWVVAYTDETAHRGEGKQVYQKWQLKSNPHMGMPGGDRFWRERQLYCSAFVGCYPQVVCGNQSAVSWRRLQVGRHVLWLQYSSVASWMSNVGEGSIEVIGVELDAGYHAAIRLPLFAIDFVIGREMYAVDFNTAPGMKGAGVERVLSAWDVCDALEGALVDLGADGAGN